MDVVLYINHLNINEARTKQYSHLYPAQRSISLSPPSPPPCGMQHFCRLRFQFAKHFGYIHEPREVTAWHGYQTIRLLPTSPLILLDRYANQRREKLTRPHLLTADSFQTITRLPLSSCFRKRSSGQAQRQRDGGWEGWCLPQPQPLLQALGTVRVFQLKQFLFFFYFFFQGRLLTSGKAVPGLLPYVRTQGFMTYCLQDLWR